MRRSSILAGVLVSLLLAFGLMFVDAAARRRAAGPAVETSAGLVRRLDLTDLCLTTEAGYTRHPSQADLFGPFGDHPAALEHFPSGSLVRPPRRWR
jgi:hypothetical protein